MIFVGLIPFIIGGLTIIITLTVNKVLTGEWITYVDKDEPLEWWE